VARPQFDCDVCELADLPKRPLAGYAAVFLLDPTPLEPATWQNMADYAAEGHGVAILLGETPRPSILQRAGGAIALAGKLLRQARRPDGDLYLAPRDFQHPILAAFRSKQAPIPWDAFPCSAIGNSVRCRRAWALCCHTLTEGRPCSSGRWARGAC